MKLFFEKTNKLNQGFTLVETLVAISIFTMSVVGLMVVLGKGIADTNYAKDKVIATYLAQEGIEYIRNMRDTYMLYNGNNWSNFKAELAPCNQSGNQECGFNTSLYSFPIDADFIKKCNSDSSICKVYLNNGNYNTNSSGVDSGFVRKIWADIVDQNKEIRIYSNVSWTQGSGSYNVTFSENLFNWVE